MKAPPREEMAKLFCLSLTRNPSDGEVQVQYMFVFCKVYLYLPSKASVVKVLGRVSPNERYKVQLALKYCKAKLTEYRSEERRKVR